MQLQTTKIKQSLMKTLWIKLNILDITTVHSLHPVPTIKLGEMNQLVDTPELVELLQSLTLPQ